jgi:hypothetical protein
MIQDNESKRYSATAVASMITNQATLEAPANGRAGTVGHRTLPFTVVAKSRGNLRQSDRSRVVDVLKKRDRPDARPPAVCNHCFESWARGSRPKLVTCKHNSVAALRQAGQWSVATGLTRAQLTKLASTVAA